VVVRGWRGRLRRWTSLVGGVVVVFGEWWWWRLPCLEIVLLLVGVGVAVVGDDVG